MTSGLLKSSNADSEWIDSRGRSAKPRGRAPFAFASASTAASDLGAPANNCSCIARVAVRRTRTEPDSSPGLPALSIQWMTGRFE